MKNLVSKDSYALKKAWFFAAFFLCCVDSFAQCISTYPYSEDFEINDGNWVATGNLSDWIRGTPAKPVIDAAGSGSICWITGGLTIPFYNYGERSWVQSPCFDFTALANPHVTFKVFWETEDVYDGGNFQYSIDNAVTWNNVGAYGDIVDCLNDNWFNTASINNLSGLATTKNGWSGNAQASSGNCSGGNGSTRWLTAKHSMPYLAGESNVIFRFTFGSGTVCNNYDGFAFDDILIEDAPLPLNVVYQTEPTGCDNSSGKATLNVSGGILPYSFSWTPSVSVAGSVTNLSAGNYSVKVTDAMGCEKIVAFEITHTPDVTATVTSQPDVCNASNGSVKVSVQTGTAPYTYVWTPSVSAVDSAIGLISGEYQITITDSKQCSVTKDADVSEINNLLVSLGKDTFICNYKSLTLYPGKFASYLWQDFSVDSAYTLTSPGMYAVTVTDTRGCTATDSLEIIEDCLRDLLIPNSFTPNGDFRNDIFYAYGSVAKTFAMRIYSRWGTVVFETTNQRTGWNGRYNGKPAPAGIYICILDFSLDGVTEIEKTEKVMLFR